MKFTLESADEPAEETPLWTPDLRDYFEQWREADETKRWVEEQLSALIPHDITEVVNGDVRLRREGGGVTIELLHH